MRPCLPIFAPLVGYIDYCQSTGGILNPLQCDDVFQLARRTYIADITFQLAQRTAAMTGLEVARPPDLLGKQGGEVGRWSSGC